MTEPDIQTIIERLDRLSMNGATVLLDARITDPADATALIESLRTMVGSEGTLVVPAFTNDRTLSDSAAETTVFHGDLAVDAALGAVPEVFRRHASSFRSSHPTHSFTASGPRAQMLLSTNRDNNPLGPVKKLNLLNGASLRIQQPGGLYTPLHLAEHQGLRTLRYRGTAKRLNIAGFEERVVIEHAATCTAGFLRIDDKLADFGFTDGDSVSLVPLRDLVRAAASAIASAPEMLLCGNSECRTCIARRAAIDRFG